jgi:membrane-bound serine protease (ClpP class)
MIGVSLTDLRLGDVARIGDRVDVVTRGDYIRPGESIEVVADQEYRRVVRCIDSDRDATIR